MLSFLLDKQLEKRQAMLLIFACASVWGLLWIPLRWLDGLGFHGLWAVLTFFLLPAPQLVRKTIRTIINDKKHRLVYLFAGGTLAAGFVLYSVGLIVGSVTKTALLFYLSPAWSSLLGMVFLSEPATLKRWAMIALGLVGCALILNPLGQSITIEASDWFGLLSGVAWSIGSVAIRRYPEADNITSTMALYLLGAVMILGALFIIKTPPPAPEQMLSGLPVVLIAALIFLPSTLIIIRVTQYISPGLVGLLMLSEAVFAILSAWILLGERLAQIQWLGGAIILFTAGMVVATEKDHSPPS